MIHRIITLSKKEILAQIESAKDIPPPINWQNAPIEGQASEHLTYVKTISHYRVLVDRIAFKLKLVINESQQKLLLQTAFGMKKESVVAL